MLLRVGAGLGFDYKHLEDRVIWNRWFPESGNRSGSSWPLRMSRDASGGLNVGTQQACGSQGLRGASLGGSRVQWEEHGVSTHRPTKSRGPGLAATPFLRL